MLRRKRKRGGEAGAALGVGDHERQKNPTVEKTLAMGQKD